jgi:hypothetical protein
VFSRVETQYGKVAVHDVLVGEGVRQ